MRRTVLGSPDAVEVILGLHIGAAPGRREVRALVRSGVTSVVDLRADAPGTSHWPAGVVVINTPLTEYEAPDGGVLATVAASVAQLIGRGEIVYVHCRAGVQRGPMVACAVLMRMGWSLADAYGRVSLRRGVTAMSEPQLQALRRLERKFAAEGATV